MNARIQESRLSLIRLCCGIFWLFGATVRAQECPSGHSTSFLDLSTPGHWCMEGPRGSDAQDAALCRGVKRRLNSSITLKRCPAEAIATFPGFQEPSWEIVDKTKHKLLIGTIEQFLSNPSAYWESDKRNISPIQFSVQAFLDGRGELRKLQGYDLYPIGNVPGTPSATHVQTVLLYVRDSPGDSIYHCERVAPHQVGVSSVPVTSDLQEIDRSGARVSSILSAARPKSLGSRMYWISNDAIWRYLPGVDLIRVCDFAYVKDKPGDR